MLNIEKPERTVGLDEKSMTWGMLIDQFIFVPLQVEEMHHPLFLKVEELEIDFKYHKLSNWAFFVPTLIDLTAIVRFKCSCALICRTEPHMLAQMTSLLQQMCNLLSLDLCSPYSNDISSLTAEDVCLMTPSHVRHLIVRIQSLSEIIIVLERLEHLSGAKFYFRDTSSTRPIIKMLKEKRNGSSCRINSFTLYVWLGKKHIQPRGKKRDSRTPADSLYSQTIR
ncbi:unnamed protein product [Rotaria socialis]|uniref:Uncharacterized protein n=1 Tax=Rotaria socialis TaxID=392032 RepID=A0A818ALR0_9BILA|nr:unnamed protein product [Rotaria socialis]